MAFRTRNVIATEAEPVTNVNGRPANGWIRFLQADHLAVSGGALGHKGPDDLNNEGNGYQAAIVDGAFSVALRVHGTEDNVTFAYSWKMSDGQKGTFNLAREDGSDILIGNLYPAQPSLPEAGRGVGADNPLPDNQLVVGAGNYKVKTTSGNTGQVWKQIDGSTQGWADAEAADPNTMIAPAGNVGTSIIVTSTDGSPANMQATVGTQGQVWTQLSEEPNFTQGFADLPPEEPSGVAYVKADGTGQYTTLHGAILGAGSVRVYLIEGEVDYDPLQAMVPSASTIIFSGPAVIDCIGSFANDLTFSSTTFIGGATIRREPFSNERAHFFFNNCKFIGGDFFIFASRGSQAISGEVVQFTNCQGDSVYINAGYDTINKAQVRLTNSEFRTLSLTLSEVTSYAAPYLIYVLGDDQSRIERLIFDLPAIQPAFDNIIMFGTQSPDNHAVHVGQFVKGTGTVNSFVKIRDDARVTLTFPNPKVVVGPGGIFPVLADYFNSADETQETILIQPNDDIGQQPIKPPGFFFFGNKHFIGLGQDRVNMLLQYTVVFGSVSGCTFENLNVDFKLDTATFQLSNVRFLNCYITGQTTGTGWSIGQGGGGASFIDCELVTAGTPIFTFYADTDEHNKFYFRNCKLRNHVGTSPLLATSNAGILDIDLNDWSYSSDGNHPLFTMSNAVNGRHYFSFKGGMPDVNQSANATLLNYVGATHASNTDVLFVGNNLAGVNGGPFFVNAGSAGTKNIRDVGNIYAGTLSSGVWTILP